MIFYLKKSTEVGTRSDRNCLSRKFKG